MDNYQFILRFDDADHQLTTQNGLSIEEVSTILSSLSRAIGISEGEKVVLSDVRGNCYALELTTLSVTKFETLKVIHKKISESDFEGLSRDQKMYAATIKNVIENRNYNFKAYDHAKDFIVSIVEVNIPLEPTQYYNRGAIYGRIMGIGGKSIDGTASIDVSGAGFPIKVTPAQERELLNHYKKEKIRFLVRKRIKIENDIEKVAEANLISFEVPGSTSFEGVVAEISSKKNLFSKMRDSARAVRKLRD